MMLMLVVDRSYIIIQCVNVKTDIDINTNTDMYADADPDANAEHQHVIPIPTSIPALMPIILTSRLCLNRRYVKPWNLRKGFDQNYNCKKNKRLLTMLQKGKIWTTQHQTRLVLSFSSYEAASPS